MSYDIEFYKNTNGKGYVDSDLNITSNLRDMFNWAYNVNYWVDLVDWKSGNEVLLLTVEAIKKMLLYPEKAKKFNANNDWGIYEHALNFLIQFCKECEKNKQLYIKIDK